MATEDKNQTKQEKPTNNYCEHTICTRLCVHFLMVRTVIHLLVFITVAYLALPGVCLPVVIGTGFVLVLVLYCCREKCKLM